MRPAAIALGLALALTAVASLPGAGAHEPDPEAVYKFAEPGEAKGWSNATLDEGPSQQLRESFDHDEDGTIGEEEAHAIETFLEGRSEDAPAKTAWDGEAPAESDVLVVNVTNAEGPVDREENLHLHSRSELTYPAEASPEHVWSRLTDGADEDRHLKIKAPPGYVPTDHGGFETVEQEGAWLHGETTSQEDVYVEFGEETDREEIPASLGLALFSGLIASLWTGRRTR